MKKIFKLVAVVSILFLVVVLYMLFIKKPSQLTPLEYVPNDAVYILETDNLTDAWQQVSRSSVWKHLVQDKAFDFLKDTDQMLNELLLNNKTAKTLLKDRPITMSAHLTALKDYEFLYIIDLEKAANFNFLMEKLLKQVSDYSFSKLANHTFVLKPKDKKASTIYVKTQENLLVVSLNAKLVAKVQKQEQNWLNNAEFTKVSSEISKNKLVNFYFNYNRLPNYLRVYMDDVEAAKSLAKQLDYAAFDLSQDDELINMQGFTKTKVGASYLNALLDVKPGKLQAHHIISDKMALYVAVTFKNYKIFYESMLGQYASDNKNTVNSYRAGIRKAENFFNIDVNRDVFDWIGTEIALVNVQTEANKTTDALAVIHTNDIDKAKERLTFISEQIRKKSPFKFKKYSFHNYEINYLYSKGFFELLFGKLFQKIQKPYFTYIADFVVFSNSEKALQAFITDYTKGHILSHDEKFMNFKDELASKATLTVFVQTPKLYANLYKNANASTKNQLKEKEQLLLSFNRIAFQLKSNNELFNTQLLIDQDQEAPMQQKLENLLRLADESVHVDYFEYVQFKTLVKDTVADGYYKAYYKNTKQLKLEGNILDHKPDGLWRSYYASGNTQYAAHYDSGSLDGEATFFYDNKEASPKVILYYSNDFIDGNYKEFYKNGQEKVFLHYNNGVRSGKAAYYYPSGQLKLVGKYKKGKQKGKWLYYDTQGEAVNKVRY